MHSYSIDRDLRSKVVFNIFILSMVVSYLFQQVFSSAIGTVSQFISASSLGPILSILNWLEINPDISSFPFWYGFISWLFNNHAWKLKPIQKLHGIPNLNGQWSGTLTSSHKSEKIKMLLDISQTWNKISFKSTFPETNSSSYSKTAAISIDSNSGVEISFSFRNTSLDVSTGMQSYDGYNILWLNNPTTITAKYFNDRINPDPNIKGGNKGIFKLSKVTDINSSCSQDSNVSPAASSF